MIVLVSIDDTDDLESKGTGELADEIATMITEQGWGRAGRVTRHQLFVHPDIPYTSHNSAMCFQAEIEDRFYDDLIRAASSYLRENSALTADPGLCVAAKQALDAKGSQLLTEFGRRAKCQIVTKEAAYALAQQLSIHLSEHGGTGMGVIGALAGAGLRLSGNDGRFKGKIKLDQGLDSVSVEQLKQQTMIELVQILDGETLGDTEKIKVGEPLKTVLLGNRCVLLVTPYQHATDENVRWAACSKQFLRDY